MSPSRPERESGPVTSEHPWPCVLGVDPGLAATGFAVLGGPSLDRLKILQQGTIRTASGLSIPRRIGTIYDYLFQILARYSCAGISLEDHFSRKGSPNAGLMLGPVVGVVALLADRSGLPLLAIPPRELKHRITGYGGASKEAVQRSLATWLGPSVRVASTHEGDALGLAFLGYSRILQK